MSKFLSIFRSAKQAAGIQGYAEAIPTLQVRPCFQISVCSTRSFVALRDLALFFKASCVIGVPLQPHRLRTQERKRLQKIPWLTPRVSNGSRAAVTIL